MYFPKEFKIDRALQLGNLIGQAYLQFEAYKNDSLWHLPPEYTLIQEISYERAGISLFKNNRIFETEESSLFNKKSSPHLPIGFCAKQKADIFLVFRGTTTISEWVRNINIQFTLAPFPQFGQVHNGFLQSYSIFRSVIADIFNQIDPRQNVYVSGHSLGAALATLAFTDISLSHHFKSSFIYTFASPRVGDNYFVSAYNRLFPNRSFRITNTSDIITSLPLPVPLFNMIGGYFSHIETPIDFTIQKDKTEVNHSLDTYMLALQSHNPKKGLFKRIFNWGI